MILVATKTVLCHVEATSVEVKSLELWLKKGKRQVGVFAHGEWKWAYIPAANAEELQARIAFEPLKAAQR